MSNERDKLATIIEGQPALLTLGNDQQDRRRATEIADAILAAGYRKPRTITTAEELDTLPVGSVVLHGGRAFQHYPAYPAPFDEYQKWKCGDGGFVRSTKDGSAILPATVLYEPDPQP